MTLNEYQEKAMATKMESCDSISYMMMNLAGEVGELQSKFAKAIRKEQIMINCNKLGWRLDKVFKAERDDVEESMKGELGDILWQVAGVADVMGWDLDEIGQKNLDKLASRKERGVIDGNGDNR